MSPDENRLVKKRDLRNLLTSYADEADVFTEIIQNALDAIRTASEIGIYKDESPKITIFLGRRNNESHYFAVQDNGIGMSPETAAKFTAPGFSSLKKMGKTVGYKGVGASFFFAASNRISFRTVDPTGTVSAAGIIGSLQWVLNDTSPLPIVTGDFDAPQAVIDRNSDRHGTAVVYYFDPAWKPSSLTYVVRKEDDANLEIEHWAFFLCCRTSLGRTQVLNGIDVEVEFVLDKGDGDVHSATWRTGDWSPQERKLGYPFPHKVLKVAHSVRDIENTPDHSKTKHNRKYQAVRELFTKDQILGLDPKIDFTPEEDAFIEEHLDFVEIFFAYSTDILKEINIRSGCRAAPIRYGIKLSVD
ncbi:ATP-binding protein [Mesorhizobium sp. L2C084A000]|nr:ATP-binding protein [Mesorhizobium sp. L2C084A000]